MKIFLLVILVVLIMLIAKGVANQYRERNTFFLSIKTFLNLYEMNIGFKKEKIKKVVSDLELKGFSKILFSEYKQFLESNTDLSFENINIITDEERKFLIDMFKSLGSSDYTNEITQLKIFQNYIQDKICVCEKEANKKYPLIIKLSFLFSLCVAIVFI